MKIIIQSAVAVAAVCLLAGCCSSESSSPTDQSYLTGQQSGGANAVQEQMAAMQTERLLDNLDEIASR